MSSLYYSRYNQIEIEFDKNSRIIKSIFIDGVKVESLDDYFDSYLNMITDSESSVPKEI
jgi:hypothetical protein